MRKLFLALVICTLFIAGFFMLVLHRIYWNNHDVAIQVKETDNTYRFYASFNRHKTHSIQAYVDEQLKTHVFTNARINADIIVDDNMNMHVRSGPGLLIIKMDKDKNDLESYNRLKQLGEHIKHRLAEDN